jgi:hypothetical protein
MTQEVIDYLKQSFPMKPVPTQVLREKAMATSLERAEAEAYKGKKWNELTVAFIKGNNDAYFEFPEITYRYYLPGFLYAGIKENNRELPIYEIFQYHFCEFHNAQLSQRNQQEFHLDLSQIKSTTLARWVGYTEQQYDAIRLWFDWLLAENSAFRDRYDPPEYILPNSFIFNVLKYFKESFDK